MLILLLFINFGAAASPQGERDTQGGENVLLGTLSDTETLMKFDNYYELQQIRGWNNMLGVANVNTDPDYITEGSGSMRLDIYGEYNSVNAYPFFIIDCERSAVTKKNFSSYESISLDVYNDTDKLLHIKMHLNVYGYSGKIEDTNAETIELAPRQWTKATYGLEDGSVRKGFNNLQNVAGVVVQFPEYRTSVNDTPNTLYIDNMEGKIAASPANYNPARQSGELLYFENDGDINFFNVDALCLNVIYNADLSVNTNPDYVSQGSKSMKCVFKFRYIYVDYFVQSKDLWVPLRLNVGAFSNFRGISFDIFNGSGVTKEVRFKFTYARRILGIDQFTTYETSYLLPHASMQTVSYTAPAPDGMTTYRITAVEIFSNPDLWRDDVYYIDNIRYST